MGSVGDAYDNAMCESFFATLECELLDRSHGSRRKPEARTAIFEIHRRLLQSAPSRHSSIGYLAPIDYEREHAAVTSNQKLSTIAGQLQLQEIVLTL